MENLVQNNKARINIMNMVTVNLPRLYRLILGIPKGRDLSNMVDTDVRE